MKRNIKRVMSFLITMAVVLPSVPALASGGGGKTSIMPISALLDYEESPIAPVSTDTDGGEDQSVPLSLFPDIEGHWARRQLERAIQDGLMKGYEDGKIYPDSSVSYAQVITLICRMLNPVQFAAYSDIGLSGTEWYAEAAVGASAMGLPVYYELLSASSISRAKAFTLIVSAFQLQEAEPDYSVLNPFSDVSGTSGEARDALAVMVGSGYIGGYGGKLHAESDITRAEFITLLYRIALNYVDASEIDETVSGGMIVSGEAEISDKTFTSPVFLDCTSGNVSLSNVTADMIVIRSQSLSELSLTDGTTVGRLVLAGSTDKVVDDDGAERLSTIAVHPDEESSVGTLVIGAFNGHTDVGGNVGRVEITGNGYHVSIQTDLQDLVISGNRDVVSIDEKNEIKRLALTRASGYNSVTVPIPLAECAVDGERNTVYIDNTVTNLDLYGDNNFVTGKGSAETLTMHTTRSTTDLEFGTEVDKRDYGIENAVVTLSAPSLLPVGETLTVTAYFQNDLERQCEATWLVDGNVAKTESVTVLPTQKSLSFSTSYEYSETMNTASTIEFRLSYTTADNYAQSASDTKTVTLENYSQEYYDQYNRDKVLAAVTTGYIGNRTTKWAEENDYDRRTKEIWVNAKGYSSATQYLIWINTTYQKVNIFEGSAGNWTLIHTFLCGTGAPGTPTPVGVYTVWARSSHGWTTGTYNVRPIVNFKTGSGYAFHSRLYNPGHTYLTDPSIGFPVSHGCIRMYDEDVQWIYDHVPNETTVVVF